MQGGRGQARRGRWKRRGAVDSKFPWSWRVALPFVCVCEIAWLVVLEDADVRDVDTGGNASHSKAEAWPVPGCSSGLGSCTTNRSPSSNPPCRRKEANMRGSCMRKHSCAVGIQEAPARSTPSEGIFKVKAGRLSRDSQTLLVGESCAPGPCLIHSFTRAVQSLRPFALG